MFLLLTDISIFFYNFAAKIWKKGERKWKGSERGVKEGRE